MDAKSSNLTVEAIDSGLTPTIIPGGCIDAQNGVSVRNVPPAKEGYQWYVFRASYGREDKAVDLLESLNAVPYVARHTVYTKTKTGVKSDVRILLPNLVFAYLSRAESSLFTRGPSLQGALFNERTRADQRLISELSLIISYYYNHFTKDEFGKNPPLTIPYRQMQDFIIATSTQKDVMPVEEQQFQIGEEVEVVMGEFKGLRGKVIRQQRSKRKLYVRLHGSVVTASRQEAAQRLIFQLPCLGYFSSALIPAAYFRKIDNQ